MVAHPIDPSFPNRLASPIRLRCAPIIDLRAAPAFGASNRLRTSGMVIAATICAAVVARNVSMPDTLPGPVWAVVSVRATTTDIIPIMRGVKAGPRACVRSRAPPDRGRHCGIST